MNYHVLKTALSFYFSLLKIPMLSAALCCALLVPHPVYLWFHFHIKSCPMLFFSLKAEKINLLSHYISDFSPTLLHVK